MKKIGLGHYQTRCNVNLEGDIIYQGDIIDIICVEEEQGNMIVFDFFRFGGPMEAEKMNMDRDMFDEYFSAVDRTPLPLSKLDELYEIKSVSRRSVMGCLGISEKQALSITDEKMEEIASGLYKAYCEWNETYNTDLKIVLDDVLDEFEEEEDDEETD